MITKIGWFTELRHGDRSNAESLRAVSDRLPESERSLVAGYLDNGSVLARTMGTLTHDVLDPDRPIIGPLETLTDGELVWPSDLAYFVRRYGADIGTFALDRIRRHGYQAPPVSPQAMDAVIDELIP